MGNDAGKVKRSVADATRGGAECKAEPGLFHPVVDARRCDGKGACVTVCPYDVFTVGRIDDQQFNAMPFYIKLKLWAHGKKTAYTPNADACQACGLCVTACPEHAIRLTRRAPAPA